MPPLTCNSPLVTSLLVSYRYGTPATDVRTLVLYLQNLPNFRLLPQLSVYMREQGVSYTIFQVLIVNAQYSLEFSYFAGYKLKGRNGFHTRSQIFLFVRVSGPDLELAHSPISRLSWKAQSELGSNRSPHASVKFTKNACCFSSTSLHIFKRRDS
jgi:hypothetical protein